MKAEYFGLAFLVIYIANVSSTASNALISIGAGGLLLYAIYDYWKNKRHFPVPSADFQIPWWLFFVSLLVDSLLLGDKASISKAVEYVYLSLPFWVLLAVYYYHPNLKCLCGSIAAAMVYVGGYSLYVYVFFNHLNTSRVMTFAKNMNGLGTLLAMSMPILLLMLVKYYKEQRVKLTVVALVCSFLGMAGLILTGSRGAVLGFVAGCLVLVIAKTVLIDRGNLKVLIYGIIVCCIVAIGYTSVFGMVHRGTDGQRTLFFKSSVAMWQDHPVLGVGLTNWKHFYYTKYKLPEAFETEIDMPHNTLAFYFSTTGLLGGIGFLVFTFGILAYLLKNMRKQPDNIIIQAMLWSFIAVSVHGLVDAGLSMKTALRLCSAYMGVTVASILISQSKVCFDEHNAFFCDRPSHILNMLNLVWHSQNFSFKKTDVFITDVFLGAQEMCARLDAEKLFAHVLLVKPVPQAKEGKVVHMVKEVQQHFENRVQAFKNEKLGKYVFKPEPLDIDWQYKTLLVPSWATVLWQELAELLGGSCKIYFMDDGFFSYNQEILAPIPKHLEGKIRKLIGHGKFGFNIQGLFLNNPDLWKFDKHKIYPLPKLDLQDEEFKQLLARVFAYRHTKSLPYIFVDQNLKSKLEINLEDLRKEVLSTILAKIPAEKIAFRLHPSQKPLALLQDAKINVDQGQNMWELMWATGDLDARKVLIGYSSTALVVPKLLFDEEPVVICLYRLLKFCNKTRLQETERFFEQVKALYKDQSRFIIVNTIEELTKVLKSFGQ